MFNVFGVCWVMALFYPFTSMITWIVTNYGPGDPNEMTQFLSTLESEDDLPDHFQRADHRPAPAGLIAKAITHITGIRFLRPFPVPYRIQYNKRLYHDLVREVLRICLFRTLIKPKNVSDEEEFQLKYIPSGMLSTSELSLMQAKKEIAVFGERTRRMFGMVKDLFYEKNEDNFLKIYSRIEKYENISDRMEIEIANYLTFVAEGRLSSEGKEEIRIMLRTVTEIESIADSCNNLARGVSTPQRRQDASLPTSRTTTSTQMFALLEKALTRMNEILHMQEVVHDDINQSYNIENEINNYRNQLKIHNMEDVNNKKYQYQDGVYYMDLVGESKSWATMY